MNDADIEARVLRVLEESGVFHERLDCHPDFADTAAFCERYGFPPERSGNTILVATKKSPKMYAACVATAAFRVDVNKTVRRHLGGARLSFAAADETASLTGMLLGGVTPFALPEDIRILVDSRIMELEDIILGGGSRSAKVRVSPEIFRHLPNAEIVSDLARPRE